MIFAGFLNPPYPRIPLGLQKCSPPQFSDPKSHANLMPTIAKMMLNLSPKRRQNLKNRIPGPPWRRLFPKTADLHKTLLYVYGLHVGPLLSSIWAPFGLKIARFWKSAPKTARKTNMRKNAENYAKTCPRANAHCSPGSLLDAPFLQDGARTPKISPSRPTIEPKSSKC